MLCFNYKLSHKGSWVSFSWWQGLGRVWELQEPQWRKWVVACRLWSFQPLPVHTQPPGCEWNVSSQPPVTPVFLTCGHVVPTRMDYIHLGIEAKINNLPLKLLLLWYCITTPKRETKTTKVFFSYKYWKCHFFHRFSPKDTDYLYCPSVIWLFQTFPPSFWIRKECHEHLSLLWK